MHRHLKTAAFYAFCLITGVGAAYCVRHFHSSSKPANDSTQPTSPPAGRGLVFSASAEETLSTDYWQNAARRVTAVHGNYLVGNGVQLSANTVRAPALVPQIAHAAGLKAALIFQFNMPTAPTPQQIGTLLLPVISAGEKDSFDLLIIGSSNADSEGPPDSWQAVFPQIREHYHHELAFLAAADNYYFIPWWNLVDAIAISGPFPLPNRPKVKPHDFELAWQSHMETVTSFALHNSKPLLLVNVGGPPSADLQGSSLAALLQATTGRPELQALFLNSHPLDSTLDPVIAKAWQGR